VTRVRYEIHIGASAARSLRKLDDIARRRIARAIDSLTTNPRPHGAVKLAGESDLYRLRTGDYRILYTIRDRILTVLVVAIGHRRDIYRR
jgi:mRNA interferase RelE/StbE